MTTAKNRCPKCNAPLAIPQPMPEKVTCANCRAVLRLAPAPVGVAAAATADTTTAVQTSTAKMVAGYELQRELARGGLGVVFLAFHPRLKHYRAIKRPQPRAELDGELLLGRFQNEIEALGALESKHIIRCYDAGTDADGPYLVMEYLDGEALSSLVSRHRQLPVAEACELIRQAALGLQAAHECGLVHRDIKPSNLMLARASSGTARVTVIDWGLVKRMGEADGPANRLTKMRSELGTPDYIAPEQARDASSVDIRADIYSLGVTLFFLLTGKPISANTPPLEQLRPDVPPGLLNILKKMIKKERTQRYATPAEVATALQPFCTAEPNRLLALLAPVSFEKPAANETARIYDEKTQIAPPPSAPLPEPQPSSHRLIIWGVAAASVFLLLSSCILIAVIGVGLAWNKKDDSKGRDGIAKGKDETKDVGTKDKPSKSDLPQVLINEDFRAAYEKKTMPDGWESDAFRVEKQVGEPYLEVSKAVGVHFVTLPPVSLKGDFVIEGNYLIWRFNQALVLRLESRKTNEFLPVTFDFAGKASILDDVMLAPTNYKGGPTQFLLKREGRKLRVYLNGEVVGVKDMPSVGEYDTIKIGMHAGPGYDGQRAKLSFFKVTALP